MPRAAGDYPKLYAAFAYYGGESLARQLADDGWLVYLANSRGRPPYRGCAPIVPGHRAPLLRRAGHEETRSGC